MDLVKYESGFNAGYSLCLLHENPQLIQSIDNIASRNKKDPCCLGIHEGFMEAMLEKRQAKHKARLQELDKINKDKGKDIELNR